MRKGTERDRADPGPSQRISSFGNLWHWLNYCPRWPEVFWNRKYYSTSQRPSLNVSPHGVTILLPLITLITYVWTHLECNYKLSCYIFEERPIQGKKKQVFFSTRYLRYLSSFCGKFPWCQNFPVTGSNLRGKLHFMLYYLLCAGCWEHWSA